MHLRELKKFKQHLTTKLITLKLGHMNLLSGTWAEVLDTLQKTTRKVLIEEGTGGELQHMSREEKRAIFIMRL